MKDKLHLDFPSRENPAIDQLAKIPAWVLAELPSKRPLSVTGAPASSTDPSTWSTYDDAFAAFVDGVGNAAGFVLNRDMGIVVIDLDHCIIDGIVEPWAQEIIDRIDSYTELSQSGEGIHIFALGKMPELPDGKQGSKNGSN
jgi:putative DNA primase/helicase